MASSSSVGKIGSFGFVFLTSWLFRNRSGRRWASTGAADAPHHIRMEPTLTMASKLRFINTFGCGAGFPWLPAHTTPTCLLGHPQLHGPAAGMDIYTPLRYWNTSTWVPYGCVHLCVHPDTYTRISTRTTALWRQLGAVTMTLADPCATTGCIYTTGVLAAADLVNNRQLAYITGSSSYRRYMPLAQDWPDWLLRVLRTSGRSRDSA